MINELKENREYFVAMIYVHDKKKTGYKFGKYYYFNSYEDAYAYAQSIVEKINECGAQYIDILIYNTFIKDGYDTDGHLNVTIFKHLEA